MNNMHNGTEDDIYDAMRRAASIAKTFAYCATLPPDKSYMETHYSEEQREALKILASEEASNLSPKELRNLFLQANDNK